MTNGDERAARNPSDLPAPNTMQHSDPPEGGGFTGSDLTASEESKIFARTPGTALIDREFSTSESSITPMGYSRNREESIHWGMSRFAKAFERHGEVMGLP